MSAEAAASLEAAASAEVSAEALANAEVVAGALSGDRSRVSDELPRGVLIARMGAGANCSSAGSAIDILFYTSVIAGAIAVALSAAFPPRAPVASGGGSAEGDVHRSLRRGGEGEAGADVDGAASGDDPRDEMR